MSNASNSSPVQPVIPAPGGAPPRPIAHHPLENSNSNPTPLSERQLAALRLLFLGHPPCSVATQRIFIDRHTLLRWRRSAAFPSLELTAFHQQSAASTFKRTLSPHFASAPSTSISKEHQIQRFEPAAIFPQLPCLAPRHRTNSTPPNPRQKDQIKLNLRALSPVSIDSSINSILNQTLLPSPAPLVPDNDANSGVVASATTSPT